MTVMIYYKGCQTFFLILRILKKILFFKQFLKVTLHLQLLQDIGYIPRVVKYILVAYLIPDSLYLPLSQANFFYKGLNSKYFSLRAIRSL